MSSRSPISEAVLQRQCALFLQTQGFATREEVPVLSKVADIVAVHEGTGRTLAVEVKIRHWQQGLRQALVYRWLADYVYVGMADLYCRNAGRAAFATEGIGLISISPDGPVKVLIEAAMSTRRLQSLRQRTVASAFPDLSGWACLVS